MSLWLHWVSHCHQSTQSLFDFLEARKILPVLRSPSTLTCLLAVKSTLALFRAYVRKFLVPTLAPGDVVILDNLGSNKDQAVHDAVASAGARLLFRPPYSPDLNPIEMLFSKMKAMLRRARARNFEGLCAALADILENVTMAECTNSIQAAGYKPT
ncbi:MAG: transposase [Pseudomonadota bacterium]